MGVYRTIVPVEIYLFSVYFIQKNLCERDQKEIKKPPHLEVQFSMQSVSSVPCN